ncbi:methyl-accepting chemotaxis protein [Rhizobium rhizoryzae]|uniref:Methyl-accepting chemotaxis protein-1 (Serine sensor receptor) n=2 Tax=Rhizobium rhizoryzae TaxID=451876 RepID=A0A7W6PSW1_9HYPH|nr:methyl-accepting chemotaxis protein [Rhizobium rhizoryzae]MBB4144195.1 methyl-accepting chemotaxis protein-1 (serine sensor receptor) [Rhizobium rhizoryzae]
MKRPSLRMALIGMLGFIALAVAALSFTSVSNISSMRSETADIGDYWMERLLTARDIKGEFANVRLALARHVMVSDKAGFDAEQQTLRGFESALRDAMARYEAKVRTEQGRRLINDLKPLLADYDAVAKRYTDHVAAGDIPKAAAYFKAELKPRADKVNAKITELVDAIIANSKAVVAIAEDDATFAFAVVLTLAIATLSICVAGMYFAVAGIARPINAITEAMRRLAGGDDQSRIPFEGRSDEVGAMASAVEVFRQNSLSNKRLEQEALANRSEAEKQREAEQQRTAREAEQLRIASSALGAGLKRLAGGDLACRIQTQFAPEYEPLRQDFNATVEQLSQTVSAVITAVGNMDSGTREIASGANDLSKRTEQQAAALEETAAALDQITANVSSSSKMTEEARSVAQAATHSATQSANVVAHAEEAMQRIESSSQQISNIIGVIDEIAFQTNLLALNAGVEAARAGEAGKGFAVVAQEVRELAQRSAQAAKEIKGLIQNSTGEVEGGVKLVRQTGEALKTIGDHITRINSFMESIATSSREQSTGLTEVNVAVNQMDQTTQQNAAMVEQSTAAAASLSQEAGKLRELVSMFQLEASAVSHSSALRQVAQTMAQPAPASATARPHIARALPQTQGNLAHKADDWQEF